MRVLAERSAAKSAGEWRMFWETRGMRELGKVVASAWSPYHDAGVEARDACSFRIASLLGSRASARALAEELARIRRELGEPPSPLEDARAAQAIAAWFGEAARG